MNLAPLFPPVCLLACYVITSSIATTQLYACNQVSMSQTAVVVTDRNDRSQIEIGSGQILVLKLPTTPGLGYSWQITNNDITKLPPLGDSQLEPVEAEAPGAIENQVFRFAAKAMGSNVLMLKYVRPWEQNAPPLKTFRLTVQIK